MIPTRMAFALAFCLLSMSAVQATERWDGGYLGFSAGLFSATSIARQGDVTDNVVTDGWLGAVQLGYRMQGASPFVFGVELLAPIGSTGGGLDQNFAAPPPNTVSYRARADWAVDASLTLGYSAGQFLPFVTAGLIIAQGSVDTDFLGLTGSRSNIHTGYSLGAGIEMALSDQWSLRAQYKHAVASREDYAINPGVVGKVGMELDIALVGINYRF